MRLYNNTIGIIAGNIMAAIPMVQLIVNMLTAFGLSVIIASIMSGCSMEKSHVVTEIERRDNSIIF